MEWNYRIANRALEILGIARCKGRGHLQESVPVDKGKRPNLAGFGAAAGISAGLCCPFAGTVLSMIAWSVKIQSFTSTLNLLGIAAFVFTLPLLALGAHCLDPMEKNPHHSPQ